MTRLIPILVTLLLSVLAVLAQPPGTPKDETFSRNKKFSAELSSNGTDKPMLFVFSHAGDHPALIWSRPLAPETEADQDPNQNFSMNWDPNSYRKLVSDDGSLVVLRMRYYRDDMPAMRVLTQKTDTAFEADDLIEAFGDAFENQYDASQAPFLEVLSDSPKIFGMWHARSGRWVMLDQEKLMLEKPSAAQLTRLNELALQEARAAAQRHRPSGLRRAFRTVMQHAAAVVPSIGSGANPGQDQDTNIEAAYRFLASLKKPEDRALIEALLDTELQSTYWSGADFRFSGRGPEPFMQLSSFERSLADRLLDQWDGKALPSSEDATELVVAGNPLKLTRFGSLTGKLHLPFAAPPDSGGLFLYLIPARVEAGQWSKDDSVLHASYYREQGMRFPGQPQQAAPGASTVSFLFDTIPPGEYRLKAVWDRRAARTPLPGMMPGQNQTTVTPQAGDYESAESPVVKLAASQTVTGVDIFCTNRVGKVDQFAADDEKWAKEHPAEDPDSSALSQSFRGDRVKGFFNAPLSQWIIRTNENSGKALLRRITLREVLSDPPRKMFSVHLSLPGFDSRRSGTIPNIKAELEDEHGCTFETHGFNNSGRNFQLDFQVVPLGAKQLQLRISREDYQDERGRAYNNGARTTQLASYTLTNLFHATPADWKPDVFPAKRDLDIVSVQLAAFDPRAMEPPPMMGPGFEQRYGYGFPGMVRPPRPLQNKVTFSSRGEPATAWRKLSGKFIDRWGNEAYNLQPFCKEEEIFKYIVEVARDPVKGAFADDEKVEVPVTKIPSAGESTNIDLRRTVQGLPLRIFSIGGIGEFTYEDGNLISAKEDSDEEDAIPSFGFQGRRVEPKLSIRSANRMPMGMPPGMAVGPLIIISKTPHVVCRVAQNSRDTLFALREQDTSVPEPVSSMNRNGPAFYPGTPSMIQCLALEYRPGETNKKLTFIVQKTRKAEFFVKVPKDERPTQN